ncbi:MAG TPA: tyrosine-type recombinase/integrase [Opitutaceae bacterium]|nr:tyrosine-type recombinase/integrase [Opitutaceae bacterium]
METEALGRETKAARKVVFHRVAENLYRLETSGGYYALVKRGGKQFRRSLKTKDRKLAERRLSEFQGQVGNLSLTEDARLTFEEIAERWMSTTAHTLKPASVTRRRTCLKNLAPFFKGVTIRNIQPQHCEAWVTTRVSKIAAQTMAHELNAMRAVFDYAFELGIVLSNPAKGIKRRKIIQAPIVIPTRSQFRNLLAAIRDSDGRADSQRKAKPGADFVELLAYSGCRLNEATSLLWRDIDFAKGVICITGGERGTKNHDARTVPMTEALRALLTRLQSERRPASEDRVCLFASAKKTLQTACKRLGYPQFTHHDFRHFFATTCIEAGVDIPTVSRWLGHKDGGALAMRVYGHLRQDHSLTAIQKVTF